MNWNALGGRWKQLTGKARTNWGKLTDDDLNVVAGKRTQLIGNLQERYGILKRDAEEQVDNWLVRYKVSGLIPKQRQSNLAQQAQGNPNAAPQEALKPDDAQDDTRPSYRARAQGVLKASADTQTPADSERPERP